MASHALVLISQVLAIFAISAPWATIAGMPLDDAWIHQVVGRTFAQTGTLGFEAGHHGSGATSYFWATLLAFNYRFLHLNPVAYTLAINLAAYLATGQCLLLLLRRAFVPDADADGRTWLVFSVAVASIACIGGNFVWFAFSGMEATWVAFLPLLAVVLYSAPSASKGTAIWAGVTAGVMALTRPEAMLLGPLMALFTRRAARPWKHAVWLLLPWTVSIAIYFGSNLLLAGTWMPATLQGRRWLWGADFRALSPIGFFHNWFYRLEHYTLATSADAVAYIALGLMLIGIWRLLRTKNAGLELFIAWATAHMVTFLVLLPSPGHGGRYQPLVPLLFLGGAAAGACTFTGGIIRRLSRGQSRGRWAAVAVAMLVGAAPFAICGGLSASEWSEHHKLSVSHIRATEAGLGAVVDALPKDARVASFDIGAIAFEAKRPIVEIGGLLNPKTAKLLHEGRIWEYLRDSKVDYLILPAWYHDEPSDPTNFADRLALANNPAISLEPVRELETRYDLWHSAIDATWNASPRQLVYRVHYTGKKGPNLRFALAPAPPFVDPGEVLSRDIKVALGRSLSVLAAQNVLVELEVVPDGVPVVTAPATGAPAAPAAPGEPAAPADNDRWHIKVGKLGFEVRPPTRLASTISVVGMRELFGRSVVPYVEAEDLDGAALAAVRAVPKIIREYIDPTFLPQLSIPYPPRHRERGFEVSWSLLAIVLGAFAVIAAAVKTRRLSRNRRRVAFPAGEATSRVLPNLGHAASGAAAVSSVMPVLLLSSLAFALGAQGCSSRSTSTDLTAAVESGEEIFFRLANTASNLDEYGSRGQTPLMRAAERNNPRILIYLLAHGADCNRPDGMGHTALHIAAKYGHLPIVRALLANNCAPAAVDIAGQTPLHLAVKAGQVEVAKWLVRAKADPQTADNWGSTALHMASKVDGYRGRVLAKILLDAGAPPATFDASGYTPLHIAALYNNVQIIEEYEARGLDLSVANATGLTPTDVALLARTDWAGQTLMRAGGKPGAMPYALPPMHEAAKMNNTTRLLSSLAFGTELDWTYQGKTPRELAAEFGSQEAVAILDRLEKQAL